MKALLKGSTITVFMKDGTIVTNTNADKETYAKVISAETEEEVRALIFPELTEEEAKAFAKSGGREIIEDLISLGIFEKEGGAVYRKGIKLSIPEMVLDEYISAFRTGNIDSKRFQTIDNFWKNLSLCPNPESREDLFKFLAKHGMRITPQGMVLAYRRVVSKKTGDIEKITAISNTWLKVKTVWKYNPSSYFLVIRDGDYKPVKDGKVLDSDKVLGNLNDLYESISRMEAEQFTDAHTRTYDYKIGVENRMERSQGNQSNKASCSTGFHLASKHYDYSGFGDKAVLCIFNPMDTLAVPQGEDGKLRVCAFTILSVLDNNEENTILDTADLSDLILEHYEAQVANLEKLLSQNTPYELGINNILSSYDVVDSKALLEEARKNIKGRLIKINE